MGRQTEVPGKEGLQTQRANKNAAPPPPTDRDANVERYPPEGKDDAVERGARSEETPREGRSFGGEHIDPEPPQGGRDGGPEPSVNQGRLGPGADPAEGKR